MIHPELNIIIKTVNSCSNAYSISVSDVDTPFEELNIDSIGFVRIVVSLEKAFDCEIPIDMLILSKLNTINKIHLVLSNIYKSELNNDRA